MGTSPHLDLATETLALGQDAIRRSEVKMNVLQYGRVLQKTRISISVLPYIAIHDYQLNHQVVNQGGFFIFLLQP